MAAIEMDCPICEGNVPLHGDERDGDEVYCGYCGVMSQFKRPSEDEDTMLEADY